MTTSTHRRPRGRYNVDESYALAPIDALTLQRTRWERRHGRDLYDIGDDL